MPRVHRAGVRAFVCMHAYEGARIHVHARRALSSYRLIASWRGKDMMREGERERRRKGERGREGEMERGREGERDSAVHILGTNVSNGLGRQAEPLLARLVGQHSVVQHDIA